MEFSSSQFDDQDVFHVSDLFSLHFCIFCWLFELKKKLCEGAYILKVIIATLYKGAKNKLTNKDSINIHQRIDASGVEWTDSIFGGTYVLPQIVLTLVLTFW